MKKPSKNVMRVINIVGNVLIVIICVFILMFAIMAINKSKLGYNKLFGHTALAVETHSMDGETFKQGDLIFGKLLKDSEKTELEKDQIITFWAREIVNGEQKTIINTHRIVDVIKSDAMGITEYKTKGDANTGQDEIGVLSNEIISVYTGKIKGLGSLILFLQGRTGFLILVVVPSVLAAAYCVLIFVKNLKGYGKVKQQEEQEALKQKIIAEKDAESEVAKQQLREQLLEEMKAQGLINNSPGKETTEITGDEAEPSAPEDDTDNKQE